MMCLERVQTPVRILDHVNAAIGLDQDRNRTRSLSGGNGLLNSLVDLGRAVEKRVHT